MVPAVHSAMEGRRTVPDHENQAGDIEEIKAWAAGLQTLHARIASRFARAEPRRWSLAYLRCSATWGERTV
jgi:hypothetical protein